MSENRAELIAPQDSAAAAAPATTSLGTHYLRYSTANFMVLLAGFISFPLLTRLLDNTQYGILGYYETWIVLTVAVAKFGAQHSIIRFYPHQADPARLEHFATNLLLFPIVVSFSIWAVLAAVLGVVNSVIHQGFSLVFWCAVLSIPMAVLTSLVDMVFRASERSMLLTLTRVVRRWLELAIILGAVIFIERSALAVYSGKLVAAGLAMIFYVHWLYRNLSFSRAALDLPAIRASLVYGLPLVANEVAAVTLGSIDRVMVKHMMGDFASVGIYTIGYSLAINVSLFMNATLNEAFIPVANRLYGNADEAAIRALKDRILLPMTYASIGVAALLWSVGESALVALSGPGKAASGQVFTVVGTCFALYPLTTFGAAVLNIALNLVLIPMYGVMGAVWATVISYAALGITTCILCPRGLLRFPEPRVLALACTCALALLLAIRIWSAFYVDEGWLRLFVAGWLFLGLYALPVWLLDSRLREAWREWRGKALGWPD